MSVAVQNIDDKSTSYFVDNLLADGASPEILAFVGDETTRDTCAYQFASMGVAARVGTGGIGAAINYLADNPSPTVLLVDLGDNDEPMALIDQLAEVCEAETPVIALGNDNDVNLYRELIHVGFADYLVKPLTPEMLSRAIEKANRQFEEDPGEERSGELVVVIGARGGVGASTVAVNCAWQIADGRSKRVALIDLDLQFGTVALALDLEPGRGLREMLENPGRIDSLFIASAAMGAGRNLYVLGSEETLSDPLDYTAEALEALLNELRRGYDLVIVDIPRAAAVQHRAALAPASSVVIVSDLSLAGVRDTSRLIELAKDAVPQAKRIVVANRVGADKKHELPRGEFERGVECKIAQMVPEDAKAAKGAHNVGKPIEVAAKASKIVASIDQLCGLVLRDGAGQAKAGGGNGAKEKRIPDLKFWKRWSKKT